MCFKIEKNYLGTGSFGTKYQKNLANALKGEQNIENKKAFDNSKALIKIGNDLLFLVLSKYHQR